MTGVIEGFRWALLGKTDVPWHMVTVSSLVVIGLLLGGLLYFNRMEKDFADVI